MTDLNERVQARITDLETRARYWFDHNSQVSEELRGCLTRTPASWRERWDRHKPYPMLGGGAICPTCVAVGLFAKADQVDAPCVEALSVLREIGIKP